MQALKRLESFGAPTIQRKFDNWSSHQNWAVNNISFKIPWVFYMAADECCTDELRMEIQTIIPESNKYADNRHKRKDYFMGRWL
jgi:hypothetical protein